MTIAQLIDKLEAFKYQFGDLKVNIYVNDKHKEFPVLEEINEIAICTLDDKDTREIYLSGRC